MPGIEVRTTYAQARYVYRPVVQEYRQGMPPKTTQEAIRFEASPFNLKDPWGNPIRIQAEGLQNPNSGSVIRGLIRVDEVVEKYKGQVTEDEVVGYFANHEGLNRDFVIVMPDVPPKDPDDEMDLKWRVETEDGSTYQCLACETSLKDKRGWAFHVKGKTHTQAVARKQRLKAELEAKLEEQENASVD